MNREIIEKMRAECEREAKLRARVYPRWVEQGKMECYVAEDRIYLMRLAAETFEKILKGSEPKIQQTLFDVTKLHETS